MINKKLCLLAFGIFFGFVLSRVGASDFNLIYGMFVGSNLTLAGVMITAIVVGAIGMQFVKKTNQPMKNGESLKISQKKLGRYSLAGAAIFGLGWGLSGACPGTVLAQLGEGKVLGLFTFLGVICGTYIYGVLKEKNAGL